MDIFKNILYLASFSLVWSKDSWIILCPTLNLTLTKRRLRQHLVTLSAVSIDA
jgi:hypothetical protein